MNPSSLFLLGLLQLAQASNATDNTTDTTTPAAAASPAVAIIIVIVVLLLLGGALYYFVFMPGAQYASVWTNLMGRMGGGSSSKPAPAATSARPGNTLPMVALRVSGDEEL